MDAQAGGTRLTSYSFPSVHSELPGLSLSRDLAGVSSAAFPSGAPGVRLGGAAMRAGPLLLTRPLQTLPLNSQLCKCKRF